jgi:hypothetical protein
VITALGAGAALVPFVNQNGRPNGVDLARIYPPHSLA